MATKELKSKIKSIWRTMHFRWENPKSQMFYRYGGRGIKVCEDWKSFEKFYIDMGKDYRKGLSIDRIDINGNYCKENCRWATPIEQAQNTSRTRNIYYNEENMTLSAWARKLGIKRSTLAQRYYVYKWSIEKTLSTSQ